MLGLFLLAFIISFFAVPPTIKFARRFHLVDNPQTRRHPANTHTATVPRAGGLAILAGFLLTAVLVLPLNKALLGILCGAVLAVVIGLWDDYRDISPYIRLLGNIATAAIVVSAGIGIPFITNPLGGILQLDQWRINLNFFGQHSILVWADLFAILWIVWLMNMVGWSSGVDGQMPGFVVIAALTLSMMSLRFSAHDLSQTIVAALGLITAGAYLGFLPWNFYPQKIMPGYGGKSLAGYLLAVLSILSGAKVGSAVIILTIPLLDAVYVLINRLVRGKSPFQAGREHLHHALLQLGWGKRRIALFYWLVSAILGMLVLTLNSRGKVYAFLVTGVMVFGSLYWFRNVARKSKQI